MSKIWDNDYNMSEVFNSVLKGARNLPITALVQFPFFRLNSHFVAKRNKVLTDWHLMSSTLLMLMLRLRPVWLRLDKWKLFFMITSRDDFVSSQGVVEYSALTYMTRNAHVVRHLYMDFHVAIS